MERAQGEQDETQWINATRYNVFKPVNTEKLECGSSPDYVQGLFCVDTVKLVDCQVKRSYRLSSIDATNKVMSEARET